MSDDRNKDYDNLLQKAANSAMQNNNKWMQTILTSGYPSIPLNRQYIVKMKYRLPGMETFTTEKDVVIKFNF